MLYAYIHTVELVSAMILEQQADGLLSMHSG